MFWDDRQIQQRFYNYFISVIKFNKRMTFQEVDFAKPWWHILWMQKRIVALNILNVLIYSLVGALAPLWLAQVFVSGNIANIVYLILGLIFIRFLNFVLFYFDPMLRLQTVKSIENSANKYFLTTDPINHSLRSTGTIISKINRGSNSFDLIIDIASFDLINMLATIFGTIIAFGQIDLKLSLFVAIILIFIVILNTFLFVARTKLIRRIRIKSEDKAKAVSLETLQQSSYIRAVFGTTEQMDKVSNTQFRSMYVSATGWRLGGYILTLSLILFLSSMIPVSIWLLNNTATDGIISVSLLVTYFQVGNRISFSGPVFSRFMTSLEDVNDLYEFVRNFGKQTFPVLEENAEIKI